MTQAKSIIGHSDMTLFSIIEALLKTDKTVKHYCLQAETEHGQTPLHYAFKNLNVELALAVFATVKQCSSAAPELINELLNAHDFEGMRPLDLLALKIDEDHKNFIKEFHGEEKNFKIAKQYEVYTWGRSDNYNLGYP